MRTSVRARVLIRLRITTRSSRAATSGSASLTPTAQRRLAPVVTAYVLIFQILSYRPRTLSRPVVVLSSGPPFVYPTRSGTRSSTQPAVDTQWRAVIYRSYNCIGIRRTSVMFGRRGNMKITGSHWLLWLVISFKGSRRPHRRFYCVQSIVNIKTFISNVTFRPPAVSADNVHPW